MVDVHPLRYMIDIAPDLERFVFDGRVTLALQLDKPVREVALNSLDLAIWRCQWAQGDGWVDAAFGVDPAQERLTVQLPEAVSGPRTLRIDYQGLINDTMGGFYRSQAKQGDTTHRMAVTQFQESSARQAFPCMDHPLHKAVFEVGLTVAEGATVLSNTLPLREEPMDRGRKRVVFQPSPRMSTYLLFFGVGPFELVVDQQDARVRLAHLPGLRHTTGPGLEFGRQALHYCETYYDIPYPLPKMDLIAIPDFAFGAMENWGAITFRENLLLHFPDLTSKAGEQRIFEVIAHEIAHQWFGNLVTPAEWKYLWLNESFATYFGYGVVAHYKPGWGVWDQFLLTETATALTRDGLQDTFAIEIPGGEHVVINSSTAPIIYNKGASILRMIEGVIGTEAYQAGVRRYLREHQYDCAESRHLWQAFEAASTQPVTAMMQSWIGQPGHPLITVARRGDQLQLRQERFTYLDVPVERTWTVPLTVYTWGADGTQRRQQLLMDGASADTALPADTRCYKVNCDQAGFYRVAYEDDANLAALGRRIRTGAMGVADRWGVQNDLYALVRQGRVDLKRYLSYLDHYKTEEAFLPLSGIAGHLHNALLVAPPAMQEMIAARGRALAARTLERIGYAPQAEEAHTTAILRDQLLWLGALWGHAKAATFGEAQFERMTAGQAVHPDIAKAVMQIAARSRGEAVLGWLQERFAQTPSEHERMNVLAALGCFEAWPAIGAALDFTLAQVPPRNRFLPIVALAANPSAQPHLWNWYLSHREPLEQLHPLLYERVLTAIIPFGGLDREEQVRQFATPYMESHAHLADAMRLALENLEINTRMRGALQG